MKRLKVLGDERPRGEYESILDASVPSFGGVALLAEGEPSEAEMELSFKSSST